MFFSQNLIVTFKEKSVANTREHCANTETNKIYSYKSIR